MRNPTKHWPPVLVAGLLALLAQPILAQGLVEPCDRQCLKSKVELLLDSMRRRQPSALPLAQGYRITLNNAPAGIGMHSLWRTISSYEPPRQFVIDTARQGVFFVTRVEEAGYPSLLFGRLKVEGRKISEMELFLSRSKADSGLQFDPEGLKRLPSAWAVNLDTASRPGRAELEEVAMADFDPSRATLAVDRNCEVVENGTRVVARIDLDGFLKAFPSTSQDTIERIKQAKGRPISIGCDRVDPPTDKSERILVDEVQSTTVTLAMVPGMILPNRIPPPGPNPEFPTEFVPDSMKAAQLLGDQAPAAAGSDSPASAPMPAVLACAEVLRYYGHSIHGIHRLMQIQPVGSESPWTRVP